MKILEWSLLEYEEKERSNDWFWALGIIVFASSLTSIIFKNYFFAIFLILSGFVLWIFAIKKPDMVHYSISDKGLQIRDRLFQYEKIKSFFVQIPSSEEPNLNYTLFIKTERLFMPVLSIPIESQNATDIKNIFLSKSVKEEEMREHPSYKIMDTLGF